MVYMLENPSVMNHNALSSVANASELRLAGHHGASMIKRVTGTCSMVAERNYEYLA